jgi:hypothetical protein
MIPTDELIFFKMVETTNQIWICHDLSENGATPLKPWLNLLSGFVHDVLQCSMMEDDHFHHCLKCLV